jgi:hypothetical protein
VPAERPDRDDDERRAAPETTPDTTPAWEEPEPYDPERETVEPQLPAAVP